VKLQNVPLTVHQGDSVSWQESLSDYPAGIWTLTLYCSRAGDRFEIQASADGDIHSISVPASVSSDYGTGRFRWFARVTDGTDVFTIDDGWIEVLPNPASDRHDWRSHARKMLDAIEATLEGQASDKQLDLVNYSFGTVNVSRDRELLQKWRDKYARELINEDGGRSGNNRMKFIRFGAA
jgi:hypothetical protein